MLVLGRVPVGWGWMRWQTPHPPTACTAWESNLMIPKTNGWFLNFKTNKLDDLLHQPTKKKQQLVISKWIIFFQQSQCFFCWNQYHVWTLRSGAVVGFVVAVPVTNSTCWSYGNVCFFRCPNWKMLVWCVYIYIQIIYVIYIYIYKCIYIERCVYIQLYTYTYTVEVNHHN